MLYPGRKPSRREKQIEKFILKSQGVSWKENELIFVDISCIVPIYKSA